MGSPGFSMGRTLPRAAPAFDPRELAATRAPRIELDGEARNGLDLADVRRTDEELLVGTLPPEQKPAPARRPGDVAEVPLAAEDDLLPAQGVRFDDQQLASVSDAPDHGDPAVAGSKRRVHGLPDELQALEAPPARVEDD